MSYQLIIKAATIAHNAHKGQFRKYGWKLPYIIHPIRVAGMTTIYYPKNAEMIAAAWLHDVLEDTQYSTLKEDFGEKIYELVCELTNPSKGLTLPRHQRKTLDREHIKNISREAKIIKLIDRIDNLLDVVEGPKDFIELYSNVSRKPIGL